MFKKSIESVRAIRDIQGRKGFWDHDQYMLGLYNGLEMALAIMEGREPELRHAVAPNYKAGSLTHGRSDSRLYGLEEDYVRK